jgi:hypothetical protein
MECKCIQTEEVSYGNQSLMSAENFIPAFNLLLRSLAFLQSDLLKKMAKRETTNRQELCKQLPNYY